MKLPPEKTRISHIDQMDKVQIKNEINTSIHSSQKTTIARIQSW